MNTLLERPKGSVYLQYYQGEKLKREDTIDNAVVSNAKKLISRALGGDANYLIDIMEVWYQGTVLASSSVVVSYESIDSVRFTAIFREEDFTGDFDELVLKNSANGNFSEVTGITATKSATEKMAISWDIKPQ